MGRTIEQMIADGMTAAEIHKEVERLTRAKEAAEEAARQEEAKRKRAAIEKARKAEKNRGEFIDACIKYFIAIGAMDKEDIDDNVYNTLEETLKDFEAHTNFAKSILNAAGLSNVYMAP